MQVGRRNSYDVGVVGTGPAGVSAAIFLSRQGLKVVLFEKSALPRYKPCGGGVVSRAAKLLPLNVPSMFHVAFETAELNLLDARLTFTTSRPDPIVSMTVRADFDYQLAMVAQSEGAALLTECRVLGLNCRGEKVEIETNRGTFSVGFVVGADGALSTTARKAGFRDTRKLIPALESEMVLEKEALRRFSRRPRIDFGAVQKGYGWVFPKNGHLSIGVVSRKARPSHLNEMFMEYLGRLRIHAPKKLKAKGFVIPVSPRKGPFMKNRTLLVGDAAGFADPVTFEGITHAILSGRMAARALVESELDEAGTGEIYESFLKQEILPELKWGRRIAWLVYECPPLRNWLFRHYGKRMVERMTDVIMGTKTYREILLNPSTYFKEGNTAAHFVF